MAKAACWTVTDTVVYALYFHGRQVIKPENLISQENDVSTLIGKEPLPMETKDTEISSEKQVSMGII